MGDEAAVDRYYDLIQRSSLATATGTSILASAKAALATAAINIPAIQNRMALRIVSLTLNATDQSATGFLTVNNMVARVNAGTGPSTIRFYPAQFAGQPVGFAGASLYVSEDTIIQGDDYAEFGRVANNAIGLNFQVDVSNTDAGAPHTLTLNAVVLFELYQSKNAALTGQQRLGYLK
jgi:hypothetical protein